MECVNFCTCRARNPSQARRLVAAYDRAKWALERPPGAAEHEATDEDNDTPDETSGEK